MVSRLSRPTGRQGQCIVQVQAFQGKCSAALCWLQSSLERDGTSLWSPYTFSNAYILIGIQAVEQPLPAKHLDKVVHWFENHQGMNGGFEDIEDTSLAILALVALLRQIGFDRDLLADRISALVSDERLAKRSCFLGYSGKASPIARDLKEHLLRVLPTVSIIDWKWDFRLGQILYHEIKRACDDSQAAIFLVTKDDTQVISKGAFRQTPRDNIIFEYGYFSGRIGVEKTILVVEEDTKVPSDLGGLLYVHMADRENIAPVKLDLERALRSVLNL
jgi:hypothetical protein